MINLIDYAGRWDRSQGAWGQMMKTNLFAMSLKNYSIYAKVSIPRIVRHKLLQILCTLSVNSQHSWSIIGHSLKQCSINYTNSCTRLIQVFKIWPLKLIWRLPSKLSTCSFKVMIKRMNHIFSLSLDSLRKTLKN